MTIPSLLAAGTTTLARSRFGIGSGILNMGRQVGTVLGTASLVAILAPVDLADPLVPYRHGLILLVGFFVAAGVVSAITLTRRTPAPGVDAQSWYSLRTRLGGPHDHGLRRCRPRRTGRGGLRMHP